MAHYSAAELRIKLNEQDRFIHRSADGFDSGEKAEAVRLAATLRVLLHDGPGSISLLAQLGVKNDLDFLSTGYLPKNHEGSFTGAMLAPMRFGTGRTPEQVALLHEAPQIGRQSFYHWWHAIVIGSNGFSYTREDCVLRLANDEGGSHVSPKLREHCHRLYTLGLHGMVIRDEAGRTINLGNPVLPTVRQIAFEVDVTIHEQLAHLMT